MRSSLLLSTALLALPAVAHAQLGGPLGFNVFLFENFTASGSDTRGRLAVGGNASLGSYGTGMAGNVPAADFSLYVAGTLNRTGSIGVNSGRGYAGAQSGGGSVSFNGPAVGPMQVGGGPLDAALTAERTLLTNLSAFLATQAQTAGATVTNSFNTWTFTGTDAGLNIFNVMASGFNSACTINVNIPVTATAIINVTGTTAQTTQCGMFINGGGNSGDATTAMAGRVLWNYHDATTLTFRGSINGSLLAPNADVTMAWSQLVGDFVAKSATSTGGGNTQFYQRPFVGTLPSTPVPEPSTYALLATGLLALGVAARRRR